MTPKANIRLKRERELRGWSQTKVAQEIGIDPTTVGRWERGLSLPYPHFRAKLCVLFNKNASELGFVLGEDENAQHEQSRQEQGNTLSVLLLFPLYDSFIPIPALNLVGREDLFNDLKRQLCYSDNLLLALSGLPGIGKTTLAAHLVREADVQARFHDGILWVGLGPKPHIASHLQRWGQLLGVDMVRQEDCQAAFAKSIRAAIGTRRLLLVLDDAWTLEDALAFKVGGPNCSYLLTTRFPPIALAFAPQGMTVVRELNEEESVTLLTRSLPDTVTNRTDILQTLVRSVGGLPLALVLMSNYLRVHTYSGQTRRVQVALEHLQDEKQRLYISKAQGILEHHTSLAYDTPLSLQSVIGVSDQHLSEQGRAALRALAVLPAKPYSFSEEAASAITGLPATTLDELCDAGLLESADLSRYTLHQTISAYACIHLSDMVVYQRFVTYFVQYIEKHKKDYAALDLERDTILAALDTAFERGIEKEFVRGIHPFAAFLCLRGLYTLAEPRLHRAYQIVTRHNDIQGIILSSLYLGEIAEKRGEYNRADEYFAKGLTLARLSGEREQEILLIAKRGGVAYHRGDITQVEAYIQEGLAMEGQLAETDQLFFLFVALGAKAKERGDIAQALTQLHKGLAIVGQTANKEQRCLLLLHLGAVTAHCGDFRQAVPIFEETLIIARQIGHNDYLILGLIALGITLEYLEEYTQANLCHQEGIILARQVGNPVRISILLTRLGWRAGQEGENAQASVYFQEALQLARQIQHPGLGVNVLVTRGETYLHYQQFEEAAKDFQEALTLVPEGQQELYGQASFGMAQVLAQAGDRDAARRLGEESLKAFTTLKHHRATRVQAWLDTLVPSF